MERSNKDMMIDHMHRESATLRAQRDALLAALENAAEVQEIYAEYLEQFPAHAVERKHLEAEAKVSRASIAAVKQEGDK